MTTIIRRLNATNPTEASRYAYGKKNLEDNHIYYEYRDGNGKEHAVTVTTVRDRLNELFTIKQQLERVLSVRREQLNITGDLISETVYSRPTTIKEEITRLYTIKYYNIIYKNETANVYETMRQIRTIQNQIDVLINEQYETF